MLFIEYQSQVVGYPSNNHSDPELLESRSTCHLTQEGVGELYRVIWLVGMWE